MNRNYEKYKILLSMVETDEGNEYFAEFREFDFCSGCGASAEEAIKDARENLAIYIAELEEAGKDIPLPIEELEYSGRYPLRLSKSMHKKAAECAAREGVSLNSFISEAVCEKVGNSSVNRVLTQLELTIDRFAYVVGFAKPVLDTAVYFTQINSQTVNSLGYRKLPQFSLN